MQAHACMHATQVLRCLVLLHVPSALVPAALKCCSTLATTLPRPTTPAGPQYLVRLVYHQPETAHRALLAGALSTAIRNQYSSQRPAPTQPGHSPAPAADMHSLLAEAAAQAGLDPTDQDPSELLADSELVRLGERIMQYACPGSTTRGSSTLASSSAASLKLPTELIHLLGCSTSITPCGRGSGAQFQDALSKLLASHTTYYPERGWGSRFCPLIERAEVEMPFDGDSLFECCQLELMDRRGSDIGNEQQELATLDGSALQVGGWVLPGGAAGKHECYSPAGKCYYFSLVCSAVSDPEATRIALRIAAVTATCPLPPAGCCGGGADVEALQQGFLPCHLTTRHQLHLLAAAPVAGCHRGGAHGEEHPRRSLLPCQLTHAPCICCCRLQACGARRSSSWRSCWAGPCCAAGRILQRCASSCVETCSGGAWRQCAGCCLRQWRSGGHWRTSWR